MKSTRKSLTGLPKMLEECWARGLWEIKKEVEYRRMGKPNTICFMAWEESERGWGVRPDGCSLHLSAEEADCFIDKYNAELPDEVPDIYSRPVHPRFNIRVSDALYRHVKQSGLGLRLSQPDYLRLKETGEL
jgi:hypothetical protein